MPAIPGVYCCLINDPPQNLVALEDDFIISHNFGVQNLVRARQGDSFPSLGICRDHSVVFASGLAGLEGQSGPHLVPQPERAQGGASQDALPRCTVSGPLHVVCLGEWDF